jgi:hypothetical protein
MQNPAETRDPNDPEVAAPSEGNVATAVPLPHSTLPPAAPPVEIGGPAGPEPTRYGDWERKGRCIDF